MADDAILQKLDTLIRLQAHLAVSNLNSQKEKILFLSRAGISPREIADLLGTTANTVNVALSNARKDGSIKKRGKQEGDSNGER
ncbi:MAG: sigma-70 family RNA polymerase sigma factor [Phyllobacteriaceae bacterium]|nr:sigma-70 family RNA polymerase sigma factor [Phyllobacteriaceae bacterium]